MYSLKHNYENIYLSVFYEFLKFNKCNKLKFDVFNDTTQKWVFLKTINNNLKYNDL